MTRYWFDTEFMEDGHTIELLSIGMVCEDSREFYAENAEADWGHANEWVQANVLPHMGGPSSPSWCSRAQIAADLIGFVGNPSPRFPHAESRPEFWAYYGDYDWVVLCQLYGRMIDLPKGWPMFAMDVKQLAVDLGNPKLPEQTSTEHNALEDARWTRDAHLWLKEGTEKVTMKKGDQPPRNGTDWLDEITQRGSGYGWECKCGVHARRSGASIQAARKAHAEHVAADPESHPAEGTEIEP